MNYPHTIRFLIAYLLYNDGIQTVFAVAAVFAAAPLAQGGLAIEQSMLTMVILMMQFVAFGGALLFGKIATRIGAKKVLIIGLDRLDGGSGLRLSGSSRGKPLPWSSGFWGDALPW